MGVFVGNEGCESIRSMETELAARRSENNLELIDHWTVPVLLFNRENQVTYMNRSALNGSRDFTGPGREKGGVRENPAEWLAEEISAFSKDSSPERLFEKRDDSLPGSKTQEILFQRLFGSDGMVAGTMVFFFGSQEKTGEWKGGVSEGFSQAVLDSLGDPIAIVDAADQAILGVNRSFMNAFGLASEKEVIGRPFYRVADGRWGTCTLAKGFCPLRQAIATGEPAVTEHCHRGEAGEDEYAEVSAFPIKEASGRVGKVVHVVKEITARKRTEKRIQRLAFYDPLTELPNRALFMDRLNQALTQAKRKKGMVGLLFLDLDNFKKINDTLGHVTGDRLLQSVAQRLRDGLRESDTVARLGGDEFVVILTTIDHEGDAAFAARHILEKLSNPIRLGKRELYTTGSIGIALFPTDGESIDTLLKNGDLAMYDAKERGRNNYRFYSRELNHKELERQQLENALGLALSKNEFFMVYQPQWDVKKGHPTGVEAFPRWRHPELGVLPPERFLPLAEETGLIFPLGEWMLRTVCAWGKAWNANGQQPLRVGVNLSRSQFRQPNLIDILDRILTEADLAPQLLELELTEGTIMEDVQEAIEILTDLKIRGIGLAVDNFGTGHSSLNHLKNFPIDRIKIDQSFVWEMTSDPDKAAIVEAIIAISHSFNLQAVAQGVETLEQQTILASRNCTEMQGTYFASPLRSEECIEYLRKNISKTRPSVRPTSYPHARPEP